ncbi:MAG: hypothetical protein LBN93_01685, partial [Candidatus Symbiothrix sp.]|nr:hypothetical protein [Candidatus Symbiothrix sp.]
MKPDRATGGKAQLSPLRNPRRGVELSKINTTWEEGYAAFTYSFKDKESIINYIKNQQEHHKKESSKDELMRIFKE